MLPDRLIEAIPQGARVVEVGVGARWDTLQALQGARPGLDLVATDTHEGRLVGAPGGITTLKDDITDPKAWLYEGAWLIYAVRCPEELQTPLAKMADQAGARLALRVLKDELVDLTGHLGEPELISTEASGSWRIWGLDGPEV